MLRSFVLAMCVATGASSHAAAQPSASKIESHKSAPVSPRRDFVPVGSWFSYGAPADKGSSRRLVPDMPATSAASIAFSEMAEEIIVIGERQRRDFKSDRPSDELTGPRALDAAQPVVPWPGSTCTYKDLCYDLSQPPLRASLPSLAAALFGD